MSVACGRRLAAALSTLALCAAARADVVTLANGDRLTGQIVHKLGNELILKTDYAGPVSIAWDHVVSLESDRPISLMLAGAQKPLTSRLLRAGPGRLVLAADNREAPLADVTYINPTLYEAGTGTVYNGHAALSAANVYGNGANSHLYGQGELSARTRDRRYTVGLKMERGSDTGQLTASNWLGNTSVDRFIDKKRFFYARASLENNRFTDLRLRSAFGGGYGFQFYESDLTSLSLRGGLDYVFVSHDLAAHEAYPAAGWGVKFSHRLSLLQLQAFHEQDGFVSLRNTHKLTLHSRTGLRMPIAHGITASIQVNVDWERTPAPGRKPTDRTLLMGLGYAW